MTTCFAYIRVSTARQGEKGVSLQEQQSAIREYAERNDLTITQWFEERETAAKRGRPQFTKMLQLLRRRKADGVIIHKIDRSARNLRDWADLGDLIDVGVTVHFVNESLDLTTRGGRLSADIQAVVASDYIRNLREETRKGIRGRLKQGLFPRNAPLGYLDNGPGKSKTIDPVRGPLIQQAFELYASGQHSLRTLSKVIYSLGLRNRSGRMLSLNSISLILNNTFYMGLITTRDETYAGIHEPLVSARVFARVQAQLRGKTQTQGLKHNFLFRGLVQCSECKRRLVGECQKGHIYYRCHTPHCRSVCVREEVVDSVIREALGRLVLSENELSRITACLQHQTETIADERAAYCSALALRHAQTKDRLARLMDLFLDGKVESFLFEEKKRELLIEQKELEEELRQGKDESRDPGQILTDLLELARMALLSYSMGEIDQKRQIIRNLTSNLSMSSNNGSVELLSPFSLLANRDSVLPGGPTCRTSRTGRNLGNTANLDSSSYSALVQQLLKWVLESNQPPLDLT